jgi:2-methylaconitate cis-trans-isomerase PrpF
MVTVLERELPAYFVRGGTSKGLVLSGRDLPADRAAWAPLLLAAMGSPDAYGRQLNGMGGGLSSLSKVCVVDPPSSSEVDVEYTFVQVQIRRAAVDFSGNCGNMSSAIGPTAVAMGIVSPPDGPARVRMLNRNTGKIVVARFDISDGRPVLRHDTVLDGVDGPATDVTLDFMDPGGAATGELLPTGNPVDHLGLSDGTAVEASLVDASNACVFVEAIALGLTGGETPEQIEADPRLLGRLEDIRRAASVRMGTAEDLEAAGKDRMTPLIAIVAGPQDFSSSGGKRFAAKDMDVTVRYLSNGQPHRAVPATGAMSTAAAALIPGSLVERSMKTRSADSSRGPLVVRVAHPSGCTDVEAEAAVGPNGLPAVARLSVHRTTRRLFTGMVHVPMPEEAGHEIGSR